jgi:hypothetical protein
MGLADAVLFASLPDLHTDSGTLPYIQGPGDLLKEIQ